MLRIALVFVAALFASFAAQKIRAADLEFKPLLGKLVPARCHMGTCSWFSIEAAEPLGTSSKGQLYALAIRWWESTHKDANYDRPAPRTGGEMNISFIFCSKKKPASINRAESGASWSATPLQPGNHNAVSGAMESAYAVYWAACHGAIVRDVTDEGDRLGKKLGYRFSGEGDNLDEDETLASPFDVLKW
jgi:hypothetical protein